MWKLSGAVVVLTLVACGGGGSPTAAPTPLPPTPTPPPVLSFVDGVTEAPLTPAAVNPPSPKVGDMLTASLAGYLTREQKWTGLPIALWPVPEGRGLEGAYRDLVYDGEAERPLVKWGTMRLTAVVADVAPEWAGEVPRIKEVIGASLAEVEAAGGPATAWADSAFGSFTVRVDPAHECLEGKYAACTQWWRDGSTITRAELIFDQVDYATDPRMAAHMLGYALGLQDWGQSGAAMNPDWRRRGSSYDEVERSAIHMMYQHRNPGNLLPDRDPAFTPAAGARAREVRVEPRPR
jgi:hypothetical protein